MDSEGSFSLDVWNAQFFQKQWGPYVNCLFWKASTQPILIVEKKTVLGTHIYFSLHQQLPKSASYHLFCLKTWTTFSIFLSETTLKTCSQQTNQRFWWDSDATIDASKKSGYITTWNVKTHRRQWHKQLYTFPSTWLYRRIWNQPSTVQSLEEKSQYAFTQCGWQQSICCSYCIVDVHESYFMYQFSIELEDVFVLDGVLKSEDRVFFSSSNRTGRERWWTGRGNLVSGDVKLE